MSRIANGWGKSFWIGCVLAIALVTVLPAQTKWAATDRHGQMGIMIDCQQLMADMKAGQEKLDDLVAKMNAATGHRRSIRSQPFSPNSSHGRRPCMPT